MIQTWNGKAPRIAASAFVHPSAHLIGDVEIGENSIVWPGAVLRADSGGIRIGNSVMIEDNAVLHPGSTEEDRLGLYAVMEIDDHVIIAHGAVFHGRSAGRGSLIGMNAAVLGQAVVGAGCILAAGAVVTQGQIVPDRSLVTGVPGKVAASVPPERAAQMLDYQKDYLRRTLPQMWQMRPVQ